jgi:hypothetical protein
VAASLKRMADQPKKLYTRLTRNASGLAMVSSLWLASDHLLLVRSTGYTENYSRLLLRDIKGFFTTKTERRLWWGLWWGVIALLSGIPMAVTLSRGEAPIASGIFFGLAAAMLVWNHLLGPGCRIYVVTGVQTLPVPSLVRVKKATVVLDRLQPLIEAAQTGLEMGPPERTGPPPLTPGS